jgi:hypothetical protein
LSNSHPTSSRSLSISGLAKVSTTFDLMEHVSPISFFQSWCQFKISYLPFKLSTHPEGLHECCVGKFKWRQDVEITSSVWFGFNYNNKFKDLWRFNADRYNLTELN